MVDRFDPPHAGTWTDKRRLALIRELVEERRGMRIAEVGCGTGHVLRMFRQSKLVGIELSAAFVDQARQTLVGYDVSFLHGSIESLEAVPGGFDRVICSEVLEHTLDPRATLGMLRRMLSPGGRAVITVPNEPLIRVLGTLCRVAPGGRRVQRRLDAGYHLALHQWRPSAIRALISEQFSVLRYMGAPADWMPISAGFLCAPKA